MEECDLSGLKRASCRCLFSNKDGLSRQQTLDTSSWKLWGKREAEGRSQHRALCWARPGAVSPLPLVTFVPSSAGCPGTHLEKQEHLGSPSGVYLCLMGTPGTTSGLQGRRGSEAFASGNQENEGDGNVLASKRLLCTVPGTTLFLSPLSIGPFFSPQIQAPSAELTGLMV